MPRKCGKNPSESEILVHRASKRPKTVDALLQAGNCSSPDLKALTFNSSASNALAKLFVELQAISHVNAQGLVLQQCLWRDAQRRIL